MPSAIDPNHMLHCPQCVKKQFMRTDNHSLIAAGWVPVNIEAVHAT